MAQRLRHLCSNLSSSLQNHRPGDPINDCQGAEDVLNKLLTAPDEVLSLAEREINVFPFREVGQGWFRLFVDASLGIALGVLRRGLELGERVRKESGDRRWLDDAVRLLDRALIIAGGAGREELIHGLLEGLRDFEDEHMRASGGGQEGDGERPMKRRRTGVETTSSSWSSYRAEEEDGDLLPLNPTSSPQINFPTRRLNSPSLTEFQKHMETVKEPVVLTGIMDHWAALKQWRKKSYWKRETFNGRRLVPVEIGRSYTDDDWGQKIMPFGKFLNNYILLTDRPEEEDGGELSFTASNAREPLKHDELGARARGTGYLAQHDLLQQIPSLRSAITVPDYCYLDPPPPDPGTPVYLSRLKTEDKGSQRIHPSGEDQDTNAPVQTNIWFGPTWTISPLHHDPYHNILCQVVGQKYIRLYSPHQSRRLYPRSDREPAPHLGRSEEKKSQDGPAVTDPDHHNRRAYNNTNHYEPNGDEDPSQTIDMSNTSLIDFSLIETSPFEDWDHVYPGLGDVPYQECILEAAEALYIPVGWWHYVRSCSAGISVSFWWD